MSKGAIGTQAGHHGIIRKFIRHAKTFAIDCGRVDQTLNSINLYNNRIEENYILENGFLALSYGSRNLVIRKPNFYNNQLLFWN